MTRAAWLSLAGALAVASASVPARADDALAAEAAFAEARALMARGEYARACPKLEASYALDPALGTLMNLAECLRQTGRTASAWLRYRTAAAEALRLGQPEREAIARERAMALEGKLCRIAFQRGASAPPPGATASRDGGSPEPLLLDVAVPVDPGEHAFIFAAPGREARTVRITVRPQAADGRCASTPLTIPELPPSPPASSAPSAPSPQASSAPSPTASSAPSPPASTAPALALAPLPHARPAAAPSGAPTADRAPGWTAQHTMAVIVGAAGIVAAGVGAGFGVDAISTNSAGNAQCTPQNCSPGGSALLHDAGRSADTATVLVTAGVAAIAVGVVLWVLAPARHAAPTAAALRF